MVCVQCNNSMKPAKLVEPGGKITKIWYCDCGLFYEIPSVIFEEELIWEREWRRQRERDGL